MTEEERKSLREWLDRTYESSNDPATGCDVLCVQQEIAFLRLELDETNRTLATICAFVSRIALGQPDPVAEIKIQDLERRLAELERAGVK